MADAWIKVRKSLPTNLRLVKLARLMGIPRHSALGLVVLFWSWVDDEACDGLLPGCQNEDVDSEMGVEGFAKAMTAVGWLVKQDDGLFVPEFSRYLGKDHKKRARDAERQRKHRAKKVKGDPKDT